VRENGTLENPHPFLIPIQATPTNNQKNGGRLNE
jgi:hypothetical protein